MPFDEIINKALSENVEDSRPRKGVIPRGYVVEEANATMKREKERAKDPIAILIEMLGGASPANAGERLPRIDATLAKYYAEKTKGMK